MAAKRGFWSKNRVAWGLSLGILYFSFQYSYFGHLLIHICFGLICLSKFPSNLRHSSWAWLTWLGLLLLMVPSTEHVMESDLTLFSPLSVFSSLFFHLIKLPFIKWFVFQLKYGWTNQICKIRRMTLRNAAWLLTHSCTTSYATAIIGPYYQISVIYLQAEG